MINGFVLTNDESEADFSRFFVEDIYSLVVRLLIHRKVLNSLE